MSSTWREFMSWNKYTSIASRALRQSLNETDRVAAERRAQINVRFQQWQDGQASESKYIIPPAEDKSAGLPPV